MKVFKKGNIMEENMEKTEFDLVVESLQKKKASGTLQKPKGDGLDIDDVLDADISGKEIENPENSADDKSAEETPKPVKRAKKKKNLDEMLGIDDVEPIDISEIKIVQKNAIEKNSIMNSLYSSRREYQIIASQSGYQTTVSPLVNADVINLLNSSVTWYNYQKNLYKIVYDKIGELPGNMTFEQWLQRTSVEDIETFFHGIFSITFPKDGDISVDCPMCDNTSDIKINPKQLVQVDDAGTFKARKNDIIKNVNTIQDVAEKSMIGKKSSFKLPDSGIIINVSTPSLYAHLLVIRTFPEEVLQKNEMTLSYLLYTDSVLIPTGDGYFADNDRNNLLKLIDNLSLDDAQYFRKAIEKQTNTSKISYSIKNVKCPVCGHVTERIPISMQDILFTAISEKV